MEITIKQAAPDQKDKDLVKLLAEGFTVSEISIKKKISKKSIVNHIERLKYGYNCSNTPSLVAFFIRQNFIQ